MHICRVFSKQQLNYFVRRLSVFEMNEMPCMQNLKEKKISPSGSGSLNFLLWFVHCPCDISCMYGPKRKRKCEIRESEREGGSDGERNESKQLSKDSY